ncbi:MAG: ATP synthase F1 subunit epsilon [Sandaracinaceae bacterium]|jgi:F-type H+-transporting ATPase subunit epsilon|nr:ATP synthase F1 subunit epsilon [Sandaracinaceae bacterium]
MATQQSETLHLEVATPTGLALKADAESVQAPSVNGEFGVFPGHLPLLASLKSGALKYRVAGKEHVAAVGPGFAEAGPDKVTVLTDLFVAGEDIDKAGAEKDLADANARMTAFKGENDTAEYEEIIRDAEWAQARIDVAVEASR